MQSMGASQWMDKVGLMVLNAILLAGLPLALVAIVVKAF